MSEENKAPEAKAKKVEQAPQDVTSQDFFDEKAKEAKESGNTNYQLLYDEYLQPRESNFDLKIIIDQDHVITLYSNVSPKGIKWEETKMTDYILKD